MIKIVSTEDLAHLSTLVEKAKSYLYAKTT